MNVFLKKNDAVSGVLKVEIEKNDYAGLVDKSLIKLRRKMNIPGFRKGMVPLNLVKKLYGKQAVKEEVNKLVTEKLYTYMRDNDANMLGDLIPNESEQKPINFDTDEIFEFCFDVALSPEIRIELTKEDRLSYYRIIVDDEQIDKQINLYCKNFGVYEEVDKVGETDLVKGVVTELENGDPKAGGIFVKEAVLMPSYMEEETEQEKFIGAVLGDKIVFNPYKAYNGAEKKIVSLLEIEKEKVEETHSDFSFEIKEITRYTPAEVDRQLFDNVYGSGVVSDEAEFRSKVKETLTKRFSMDSDLLFMKDVRPFLIKKVGDVEFADDILKRWMLLSNEKWTKEQVDDDYPKVMEGLKYSLIKEELVNKNGLKATTEELDLYAGYAVKAQLAQYGIMSVSDDMLKTYAKEFLEKEEIVDKLTDKILDKKILSLVKETVTLEVKEITVEEFARIYDESAKASKESDK
jgi:trigger factor